MAPPDLSTQLAGISLPTCIYNASGPRSGSAEALHKVAVSQGAGAVLSKSATLASQNGNPHPRTWQHTTASLNSEGLPNKGIDYYISAETVEGIFKKDDETASSVNNKPYFVSLSGKTTADNITMLQKIAQQAESSKIASVELNLACPNIIGKPVVGYDLDQIKDILQQISKKVPKDTLPPLGLKLPPYLDGTQIQQVAGLINEHNQKQQKNGIPVRYVVAINTFGNATAVSVEAAMPYISSNNGFAGLSGPAVKYTALANCRKLRDLLDDSIEIVGVGGISSGRDVLEFLLCGCTAVQVGTQHWSEGPVCFDRIAGELSDLMDELGHGSVQALVGQLQPWNKEGQAKLRALANEEKEKKSQKMASSKTGESKEGVYQGLSLLLFVVVLILLYDKLVLQAALEVGKSEL